MKKLTDQDIAEMIGAEFTPCDSATKCIVRRELHMSTRMPPVQSAPPHHATLDLHQLTEEQAWEQIMTLAQSGTRTANIITGASGILKIKFQQWAKDSILTPYIISFSPINNGSFHVKFKRQK